MINSNEMRVTGVYTYPIKSLRGISATSLSAMYQGFPHDRRFMLYKTDDKQHNMHVSKYTEMCLFTTSFRPPENPTHVVVTYTLEHAFDQPDQKVSDEALEVPLEVELEPLQTVEVVVHGSPCAGYDMGDKYNDWFSERFGYAVQLLYIGGNQRKVLGNVPPGSPSGGAPAKEGWLSSITSTAATLMGASPGEVHGVDDGISFADVAPYLVISEKSWQNVQRRLPEGEVMDITKFRPNIIVAGADEDFEEDFWAEIQVGRGAKIVLTSNCSRCNSLNVDYGTGKVGVGEGGKVLKKLQSDRRVDKGAKYSPVFGRYGFLDKLPQGTSEAEINVGDEVRVTRRNELRTTFVWPNLSTS